MHSSKKLQYFFISSYQITYVFSSLCMYIGPLFFFLFFFDTTRFIEIHSTHYSNTYWFFFYNYLGSERYKWILTRHNTTAKKIYISTNKKLAVVIFYANLHFNVHFFVESTTHWETKGSFLPLDGFTMIWILNRIQRLTTFYFSLLGWMQIRNKTCPWHTVMRLSFVFALLFSDTYLIINE